MVNNRATHRPARGKLSLQVRLGARNIYVYYNRNAHRSERGAVTSPIINMACHKDCTYVSVDRLVPYRKITLREQVGIACSAGAADIVMHEHEELG